MRPIQHHAAENKQLLFLPSIFNETLEMLFDAHHYFQSCGPLEQTTINRAVRSDYANEMTRITMRLTSVMAWIMVRRAVYAGRIQEDIAAEQYRLEAVEVCREHRPDTLAQLPRTMGSLSEHSHELFERVFRLDTMAYGERH